ncbi:MAG: YvrJ family protein [Planctomycetia bacterium]|nr:YvrJ family protein [Planctomycetia bacterium]
MIEGDIIALIGSVGFPIVITLFLLKERSKETKELIKVISDLTILIKTKLK